MTAFLVGAAILAAWLAWFFRRRRNVAGSAAPSVDVQTPRRPPDIAAQPDVSSPAKTSMRRPVRRASPVAKTDSEARPSTLEAAMALDRGPAGRKRLGLHYRSRTGVESWRVVSRVRVDDDLLCADDHFRGGQRRTFARDGVIALVDVATGEVVDPFGEAGAVWSE